MKSKAADDIKRGDRFHHQAGVFTASKDAYVAVAEPGDEFIEVPVRQGGFVGFKKGVRVRIAR